MSDERLFYPATQRNREVIYTTLTEIIKPASKVFEVASGSGEHITHFAKHMPDVSFYPSDITQECLNSIKAWRAHDGLSNVEDPVMFDVMASDDHDGRYDAVLCMNMIHISPWDCTLGLMKRCGEILNPGGFLYLYGPFKIDGEHTSESNVDFEGWLKDKDPSFGVRDLGDVSDVAAENGLALDTKTTMPANNFSVVFRKN